MKFWLVKLSEFSGKKASVLTIRRDGCNDTIFEEFIRANLPLFKSETLDILSRLRTIGIKTGARSSFFKEHEGKLGDGVCALYDTPGSKLRLYCIRNGTQVLILGGGGHKPKSIRALQEDPKLKEENHLLRKVSEQLTQMLIDGDIWYVNDHMDLEGEMTIEIEE